jgi:hypothetical protein
MIVKRELQFAKAIPHIKISVVKWRLQWCYIAQYVEKFEQTAIVPQYTIFVKNAVK